MYFELESTPVAKRAFNKKTDSEFQWSKNIPWDVFGIDASDGIDFQEILNLQNALGVIPDGLLGATTLREVQLYLSRENLIWNPLTGQTYNFEPNDNVQYLIWKGLSLPILDVDAEIVPFSVSDGIDLHSTGNFSKRDRTINSVIVHWGGLNPQHLARVFRNRKASSHIGIGRSEHTGTVSIYQYIDLAHITWHAKGANDTSIGIDICQQPELKHLGYYVKNGYDVQTVNNPAFPTYGPAKIISLDPEIRVATAQLLESLIRSVGIKDDIATTEDGLVPAERFESGGVYSHFHVDTKGQGKWDVAPWWDAIRSEMSTSHS